MPSGTLLDCLFVLHKVVFDFQEALCFSFAFTLHRAAWDSVTASPLWLKSITVASYWGERSSLPGCHHGGHRRLNPGQAPGAQDFTGSRGVNVVRILELKHLKAHWAHPGGKSAKARRRRRLFHHAESFHRRVLLGARCPQFWKSVLFEPPDSLQARQVLKEARLQRTLKHERII